MLLEIVAYEMLNQSPETFERSDLNDPNIRKLVSL